VAGVRGAGVEPISARLVIHLWDGGDRVVGLPEGRMAVGRADDADICLALPEVSAHHAELRWDGTQLLMRDLSSTNGTEVNGRRVSAWTALHDGDRIRWGPVDADVVLARPEPPAASGTAPDRGETSFMPPRPAPAAKPPARRIFISHASEDSRLARDVAAILRRQRWDAWLDESDIRGGGPWAASIQQALRSSSVVVLLVTANSVAKEWVLDEIAAARNLRVPIIPAFLEDVRLPDELQFMLQRTEFVDVSGLTSFSSDDRQKRYAAESRLDDAILNVLEHQGKLNPDRVRMRIGRVLGVIGLLLVVVGFASFIFAGFRATSQSSPGFPVPVLIAFAVFTGGGFIAVVGGWMVRAGRAKGL
jgi:hypothetical protein